MKTKAIICGSGVTYPPTVANLQRALKRADGTLDDPFVILEREGQFYMQCLSKGGWTLEKREGDDDSHFEARGKSSANVDADRQAILERIFRCGQHVSMRLDFNEIEEAMTAYLLNEPEPDWLEWVRVDV